MSVFLPTDIVGVSHCADSGLFRLRDGRDYIDCYDSKRKAIEAMKARDMDIKAYQNAEDELAYWHAIYPHFVGWRPTDAVSHTAAIVDPDTAHIRMYHAVYHSFIRLKEAEFRAEYLTWFTRVPLKEKLATLQINSPDTEMQRDAAIIIQKGMRQVFQKMVGADRSWANREFRPGQTEAACSRIFR